MTSYLALWILWVFDPFGGLNMESYDKVYYIFYFTEFVLDVTQSVNRT